jgi:hypothetical protein
MFFERFGGGCFGKALSVAIATVEWIVGKFQIVMSVAECVAGVAGWATVRPILAGV